jgi:hypothetical protein
LTHFPAAPGGPPDECGKSPDGHALFRFDHDELPGGRGDSPDACSPLRFEHGKSPDALAESSGEHGMSPDGHGDSPDACSLLRFDHGKFPGGCGLSPDLISP